MKFLGQLFIGLLLTATAAASADALDEILERKTIRVGVSEFVPWTVRTETGELIGFEIDIANKIAEDMGVEAEFKVYEWDAIIPALEAGEIDVIAGGMPTPDLASGRVKLTRKARSGVIAMPPAMTSISPASSAGMISSHS